MKTFIINLVTAEPFLFFKGALIFMIGPLDMQLAYLLVAVGIDLVFGIEVARKEQNFRWGILLDKVRKKIFVYVMWISLFHAFGSILGLPDSARWSVILLLAGMEVLSAIKNTAKLGHNRLADALENLYISLIRSKPMLKDAAGPSIPIAEPPHEVKTDSEESSATEGSASNGTSEVDGQSK